MNKIIGIALIALLAASCQNSDSSETANTETASTETASTESKASGPAAPLTAPTTDPAQNSTTPAITATSPAPTVAATPVTTGSADKKGLNPEHGKPGHRCDIPVGASLSTPVQSPAAATQTGNPAPAMNQVPAPAPPSSTGNAKLNPAHGQPGHDCKVPVGQPLKS